MSTDTLIRAALDAGVELRFVDGHLRCIGKRSAVAAWAPRLRQHKAQLIEALCPPPTETAVDWRELDRAYLTHHAQCITCQAAGRGYGLRCGAGLALWTAYAESAEPKEQTK